MQREDADIWTHMGRRRQAGEGVESQDALGDERNGVQACSETYTKELLIDSWYEMIHYYFYYTMNITKTNSIA
jgi:hypothetical protein